MVNAKVNDHLKDLVASGALTGPATTAGQLINSIQGMNSLLPTVQTAVRDAFRYGLQWNFISLVPWARLSFFVLLFLSEISDQDRIESGGKRDEARE